MFHDYAFIYGNCLRGKQLLRVYAFNIFIYFSYIQKSNIFSFINKSYEYVLINENSEGRQYLDVDL